MPLKKYLHDIDLVANQLLNSRLHNITTAQKTALGTTLGVNDIGYQVYDTDLLTPFFWTGSTWNTGVSAAPVWGSIAGTLALQTDLQNALNAKFNNPSGTTLQYLRGDGSLATFPTISTSILTALPWSANHTTATGNPYLIGDVVYYSGNVYRCIAGNDSIIPTSTLYWINLGVGYPLIQEPIDWNSTSGNNQILNKPTIPAAQVNSDWNAVSGLAEILNKPTIPTVGTWGGLNYPTWVSGTPFVKMTAAGTFALDTNTYLTGITSLDVTTALGYTPGTVSSVGFLNGTGISISGTNPITGSGSVTITNTAPDQLVTLASGTGINVTGTYPSFTIDNTAPDQTVALTPGSGIGITGTYPNFTISNTQAAGIGTVTSITGGTGLNGGTITSSGTLSVIYGTTAGTAAEGNDVRLSDARIPTGTAGGDLNGTYPNPTVDGLQGNAVSNVLPATGQVLQWTGSAWTPGAIPTGGSGGGGVFYYFNYQNTTGISPTTGLPTSPVPPSQLGIQYSVGANSIDSANLTQGVYTLVCGFVTIVGTPGVTDIPAGLWDFNIWADVVGGTGATANETQFQIRVYKYNGSTAPTLLASSDDIYIYDPSVIAQYIGNVTMPQTTILATDRIYVEFWAQKNVNQIRQISFHFDSGHPSHVHTTIPSVAGTGIVKVVNGVYQSPATLIVNADVDAAANIAVSKLSMSTSRILGRTTAGSGSVEEITIGTGLSLSSGTLSNTFTGITSISVTAPIASTGSSTPTISIGDAVADGLTKGAATFTASDFNSASGLISIDYANGQSASGSNKGFLTSGDWTTFNSKQDAISFSTTGSSGAATFIANALNIPNYTLAGLGGQPQLNGTGFVKATGTTISYDNSTYLTSALTSLNSLTGATQTLSTGTTGTDFGISSAGSTHTFNLPTASGTNTGKLSNSDWTIFNNKQNTVALTTTGTSGASTFNPTTGALNIPQYGGAGGSGFGYTLIMGFNVTALSASETYVMGTLYGSGAITLFENRPSRWVLCPKVGNIVSASLVVQLNSASYGSPSSSQMQIRVHNITQNTNSPIDTTYQITSGLFSGSPPARNTFYNITPLAVNQGDQLQVRVITPAWTTAPSTMSMNVILFIE